MSWRISEFDDRLLKIIQLEEEREKRIKKERRLWNLLDMIKWASIRIRWVPGEEKRKEQRNYIKRYWLKFSQIWGEMRNQILKLRGQTKSDGIGHWTWITRTDKGTSSNWNKRLLNSNKKAFENSLVKVKFRML